MIVGNYINSIVNSLYRDGLLIISMAKNSKEANNRSFNMEDAYGCAVYYKGKIVRKGYANPTPQSKGIHHGWEKRGIEPNTGRGYLDDFFRGYRPPCDGICLVCVNAVYYAPILEDGRQSKDIIRKYKIISQTNYLFRNLTKKYKGSKLSNLRE